MKKLRIKIFCIIFSILSVFSFSIFFINNGREYNIQRNNIKNILYRNFQEPRDNKNKLDNNPRKIFLDYSIYTILLNNKCEYLGIINHTNNDNIDSSSIKELTNDIISKNKNSYVSNLILNNYSYSFNTNNTLTIIDNTIQTGKMRKYILISLIILIISETVSFFVSKFLSKWVTDPVNESFIREKRFVADASHELKTPISVIMASIDAYNSDKDKKWINNIKCESERMNKLIKELLDLASLEKDKELIMKNQNLSKIIESSVLTFESLFYDQKIKLEYNINDKIYYNCNKDSIKELMSILIDNAVKYSNKPGKVTVNLFIEDKNIVLEVKNIGIPIEEKDREKIFERFYKVDESRNRESNNYGLGLSIAKKIVELHGGNIEASSINDETTFKITWSQK